MKDNKKNDLHELAKRVLFEYGIYTENITLIQDQGLKTLWKVGYNNNYYCLKRLKHSIEKCKFTVNAQVHIYNQNGKVPKIFLNKHNNPISIINDHAFVLYSWISNKTLNFGNKEQLKLALKGLAHFHKCSIGYMPPTDCKISSKLGRWPSQYESMKNRMLKWKDQAIQNNSITTNSYLKHIDSIIEIADIAIDKLNTSNYKQLTSFDEKNYPLCHQDYGEGNVLYYNNQVFVIDLDGITYDLAIRDLRKILGKRMYKNNRLDKEFISTMLKSYDKVNKLSHEEKKLLVIDMIFPHWFFGDTKNIFKKNKNINPSKINNVAKFENNKLATMQNLLKGGLL